MTNSSLNPPLVPRHGGDLKVLGIARISGKNQDELSLGDQEHLYRTWLSVNAGLPFAMHMIAGQGSGEFLGRKEFREAQAAVETGEFDLVIAEDLSRIARRVHAYLFCEAAEEVGTRVIALNDHVDTGRKDRRVSAFFASFRHEMSNADTADRIRRTLRHRFANGGVFQFVIFGYIKPPGTKCDGDITKDSNAEAVYDEWFKMLEKGARFSEVADWLNACRVPTGSFCDQREWTGTMVGRVTYNSILKGIRVRNQMISRRVRGGRHRSFKAPPDELLTRDCPHLAFIEPERYDRVIAMLKERNSKYRRGQTGEDPLLNRPKKRTVWPGQHLFCSICGRMFVYGGHGQADHLECSGSRAYCCWQAVTVDGPLAGRKLSEVIFAEIAALPEFDQSLLDQLRLELGQQHQERDKRVAAIAQDQSRLQRELDNLLAAIRACPASQALLDDLQKLEREKQRLRTEHRDLESIPLEVTQLPSVEELRRIALAEFSRLPLESPEFGRLMQQLIPKIMVYPIRSVDGGAIYLRARFTLNLAPLIPSAAGLPAFATHLQRTMQVDLFEPAQRLAYRQSVMAGRAQGKTERQIAAELGITSTAAQRSAALDRLMTKLGTIDPYVPVLGPPVDFKKLRRHLHLRYRFEPLTSNAERLTGDAEP